MMLHLPQCLNEADGKTVIRCLKAGAKCVGLIRESWHAPGKRYCSRPQQPG